MDNREQEFKKRLLATFIAEALEHLDTISKGLLELEKPLPRLERGKIAEVVYRDIHSLKGAARAVNVSEVETLCQALEAAFSGWKRGDDIIPVAAFETLYRAIKSVRAIIAALEAGGVVTESGKISGIIKELSLYGANDTKSAQSAAQPERDAPLPTEEPLPLLSSATVRVNAQTLKKLLLHSEDMLTSKYAAEEDLAGINAIAELMEVLRTGISRTYIDMMPLFEKLSSGRQTALNPQQTTELEEFFNWAATGSKEISSKIHALVKSSSLHKKNLNRMVLGLLDKTKQAMMLPLSSLLESFPLFARDISRAQGKSVELTLRGADIEMDRRILEEIKDPLIHIIRNSLDHGIEAPPARAALGKPPRGSITITASQTAGANVQIAITDDGAGINADKVKQAAIASGLIAQKDAETLDNREALQLIFASGISTTKIITDISGRGLGLAIAREKAEKLGGRISVESTPDKGTAFCLTLPVTVATFRGILLKSAGRTFILPTATVERTAKFKPGDIRTVENREAVELDGRALSLARLDAVLGLPIKAKKKNEAGEAPVTVLVLNSEERRIAFGVDEIIGEEDVLVKPLGRQLQKVKNITGAAIIGSGAPVPVLNAQEIIRSAAKAVPSPLATAADEEETEQGKILVVEDSVTSRILLKNILEGAGYRVKTVVDGIEALGALKTSGFDAVVSDIEMPRMNGFDLTRKIRADKKLSELPVVLVTALETKEDREQGIEAGANAYIVKSSFDQGNLLSVLRQLI
jgi:two-component system chemotaxis sensor kinase CheA